MYTKKPGVADNKSYKDTYHFNDNFFGSNTEDDLPSINVDPKINDTIKENPYKSNVEIEGDEIVLKPDLSALFKAKGKKHSKGGMDVMLPHDSFVFSDDKSLAFNEKDHKLFEFKKGGTFDPKKNTPAEVLKRNVDSKHYNTLISNITDIKKDDLAKKSSTLMLEKYIETLGQVAYLQEAKKNFPTGVPDFAANSAPVYQPEVKNNVISQKQYAKYGGRIDNPYQKKMDDGGFIVDDCPCGRDPATGICKTGCTTAQVDAFMAKHTPKLVNQASPGYDLSGYTDDKRPLYSNTTVVKGSSGPGSARFNRAFAAATGDFMFDGRKIKKAYAGYNDQQQIINQQPLQRKVLDLSTIPVPQPAIPSTVTPGPDITNLVPNSPEGSIDNGREINWDFNKWQRLSQGYNLAKLATAKRYMPYRSHLNPSYTDAALVNPEQAVGDVQGAATQQINALSTLSPILRNAQASAYSGQLMDRLPGIRSQYDNQNAQIMNQNRQGNNQISNNARSVNMQNDQNYYRESIIGQQNFDNLKTFMGDQYMNNLNQDVQDNQSLAYNLATLDNPAYGYNFKSGNYYRNQKDIRDVASTGRGDLLNTYLEKITKDWDKLDQSQRINLLKIMTAKGFTPSTAKKGGRIGYNPYK